MKYAIIRPDGVMELRQAAEATEGILLTDEDYAGLISGQLVIVAGEVVTNPNPPVPPAPAVWSPNPLLNSVRAAREVALDRLMGIAGRSHRAGDLATALACDALAVMLLDMTGTPAVKAATNDAELSVALLTAYAQILAATPPNVESAFAGFNL